MLVLSPDPPGGRQDLNQISNEGGEYPLTPFFLKLEFILAFSLHVIANHIMHILRHFS